MSICNHILKPGQFRISTVKINYYCGTKMARLGARLKKLERREWQLWALLIFLFLVFVFFISLAYFYWEPLAGISKYLATVLLLGYVGLSLLFAAYIVFTERTIKHLRTTIIEAERRKLVDLAKAYRESSDIIKNMGDSLIVTDLKGEIKAVNKATCGLLGYKEEELMGKSAKMLFREADMLFKEQELGKLIEGRYVGNHILTYLTSSGDEIPVIFSGSITRDKAGNPTGIIGIAHDKREIERLEQHEQNLKARAGLIVPPLKYTLKKGISYRVKERVIDKSYEIFSDQTRHKFQGLCLTKSYPEDIRERYGLEDISIIWLTFRENEKEQTLPLTNLDEIISAVLEFVKSNKEPIVLIDCFDRIKLLNRFEGAMDFLMKMKKIIADTDSNLLVTISPDDFNEEELANIEKELVEVKT